MNRVFRTYDPASRFNAADTKILELLSEKRVRFLNEWEKDFLASCYGRPRLSGRQKCKIGSIWHRVEAKLKKKPGDREPETGPICQDSR